ncbi:MAG: DUF3793 family protein [Oscillospiraceae bacterium]|nr:DUF3793 family protein [Oscillospiraceae bacterium]
MSEYLLINHCSPTLAGIKTGNLFTCAYTTKEELFDCIRQFNKILVPKGLRLLPLRFHKRKVLIYLYRPDKLKSDLDNTMAANLLKQCGYSVKNSDSCIVQLINKLQHEEDFPHEIGLFLGYPPEDVNGFMNSSRNGCKYIGVWKVYGDVDKAKNIFALYEKYTELYSMRWSMGHRLEQLAVSF